MVPTRDVRSSAQPSNAGAGAAAASAVVRMLVVPVLAVAVWYILSWTIFVVPAPHAAVRALAKDLGNEQFRQDLLITLGKIVAAFGVATIIGTVVGTVLGLARPLRETFEPFVLIANGVPKIVLYPILLIVFGLGDSSQIVMGVIFGTLPVLVNLMSALVSMRPVYRKVARMLEVGPVRAFFRVYMPAVAPSLMVALQLGFSLSVLGVIYAELIASNNGLGQRLIQTYSVGNYPMMAASVLVILAISLGGTGLLHLLERLVVAHRS